MSFNACINPELLENENLRIIESMPNGEAFALIFYKLVCLAARQNKNGAFLMDNGMPYTPEMLASILGKTQRTVKRALTVLCDFGLINCNEGVFSIAGFSVTNVNDAAERKKERDRRYQANRRARLKEARESVNVVSDCGIDSSKEEKSAVGNTTGNAEETSKHQTIVRRLSDDCQTTKNEKEDEEKSSKKEEKEKEKNSIIHSCVCAKADKDDKARRLIGGELGKRRLMLSNAQLDDLLKRLSLDEFDYYASLVAECELNGKHFRRKTHYRAILDMAAEDRRVD